NNRHQPEIGKCRTTMFYMYGPVIQLSEWRNTRKFRKNEISSITGPVIQLSEWRNTRNNLRYNLLTNSIPPSLGELSRLRELDASYNQLSGSLQPTLGNLSDLNTLWLSSNNFTGIFPESYAKFEMMDRFVLRNCSISGSIPAYFGYLSNLRYLSLAENKLNGTIPNWIEHAAFSTMIDLSYNNFSKLSFKDPESSNISLFSCCCCQPEKTNDDVNQLMTEYCPQGKPKYSSLYINCGGEEATINGIKYESDNDTRNFYVSPKGNWGYSSKESFVAGNTNYSNDIKRVKCGFSVSEAPLYEKARFSPLSLKYYGFCLHNGNYNVTLHFAEIVYTEEAGYDSNKKRVFDVYIQGKRVLTDFDIKNESKPNKIAIKDNLTAVVSNNQLEIHLYWAGKGSSDYTQEPSGQYGESVPPPDFNGPLISAISVTADFKLGKKLSPVHIALITVASVIFTLLLILALAWMMGWLEKEDLHEIRVGEDKTVTLRQLSDATRKFSKETEIGKGSFGTVYKAEFPDHHVVAVKKLDTLSVEGIEKLKSEIYTLQSLRHENLVRLFDIYVGKGLYLVIYEYMENKSLADALFSNGYMAPEYPMYGTISSKYDVYGFGVVILELVSGRKNAGHKHNQDELEFLVCVAETKGSLLDLLDKSLTVYETKQAITILKLAVKCTNISPGVRPTMSEVVSVLNEEKTLDEICVPQASDEPDQDLTKDA
ncbi:hypothetical protein G4B88_010608, partial [Cannabis sativa]